MKNRLQDTVARPGDFAYRLDSRLPPRKMLENYNMWVCRLYILRSPDYNATR